MLIGVMEMPLIAKGLVVATVLLDDEDFGLATAHHRWRFDGLYAMYEVSVGPRGSCVRTKTYMHRWLLGLEPGDRRQVDHRNRVKTDNRRSNLRVVSDGQNKHNMPSQRTSTSQYRGVSWDSRRGRWLAQAKLLRKNHNLGHFEDELVAAEVARQWRLEHMTHSED